MQGLGERIGKAIAVIQIGGVAALSEPAERVTGTVRLLGVDGTSRMINSPPQLRGE